MVVLEKLVKRRRTGSKYIKSILGKIGFSKLVMRDSRCLDVVATKLAEVGIPSIDRLSGEERLTLELWPK